METLWEKRKDQVQKLNLGHPASAIIAALCAATRKRLATTICIKG